MTTTNNEFLQKEFSVLDKKRGALLGLAIGDALGAPVEFRPPGSFSPVTCYRSGGPFNLLAGQWTDDTSMALALADSLVRNNGFDAVDQLSSYLAWFQTGKYSVNGRCFDIGNTTRHALYEYELKGTLFADSDAGNSGNGSIMRLAPIPIYFSRFYKENLKVLSVIAEDSSRTTHGSEMCLSACRYMALIIAGLIHSESKETVLDSDWSALVETRKIKPLHPYIEEISQGSFKKKNPPEIEGSGFVVKSLEAALWAFYHGKNFEDAVLKAVNLGGDTDTTGAVCGQIAGACWGESGIPASLIEGLDRKDMLEVNLEALCNG